jgi:microcystin-dependent protein
MSTPYIGQISITAFAFAPKGWALCNGQLLAINQNQALFSLLGTQYGGDGRNTFALPDLRGRTPVHMTQSQPMGSKVGSETTTLVASQMPLHSHSLPASADLANAAVPGNAVPAARSRGSANLYVSGTPDTTLGSGSLAPAGGNLPHSHMPPYLGLNFVIALFGIFPSRN